MFLSRKRGGNEALKFANDKQLKLHSMCPKRFLKDTKYLFLPQNIKKSVTTDTERKFSNSLIIHEGNSKEINI